MLKLKKENKGFTIIEVLIVLAIAGLIMLIVFLAVPALQRNSRNTQRKNDVSRILGAINESINNNSGKLDFTDAEVITAAGDLAYYTELNVTGSGQTLTVSTPAADVLNGTTTDSIAIYIGAKCSGADADADGSNREVAILYRLESNTAMCTGQ
jgi:prepilin-type N-terminal cleavage/methylation domain-containing protein